MATVKKAEEPIVEAEEAAELTFEKVMQDAVEFGSRVNECEVADKAYGDSSRERSNREKAEFADHFGKAIKFPDELEAEAKRKGVLSSNGKLVAEPFDVFTKTVFGKWDSKEDDDGNILSTEWMPEKGKASWAAIPRVFYDRDISFHDVEQNAEDIGNWTYPFGATDGQIEKRGFVALVEQDLEDRGILDQRFKQDQKDCELILEYLDDEFDLETIIPADVVEDEGFDPEKEGFQKMVPLLGQVQPDGSIRTLCILRKKVSWTRSLVISLRKEAQDWDERRKEAEKQTSSGDAKSYDLEKMAKLCA